MNQNIAFSLPQSAFCFFLFLSFSSNKGDTVYLSILVALYVDLLTIDLRARVGTRFGLVPRCFLRLFLKMNPALISEGTQRKILRYM